MTMGKFIAVHSANGISEELINVELIEVIAELEYPTGVDDLLLHKGIKLAQMAFNSGVEWLKSKIVK